MDFKKEMRVEEGKVFGESVVELGRGSRRLNFYFYFVICYVEYLLEKLGVLWKIS